MLHEGRNDALLRRTVESVEGVQLVEPGGQTSRIGGAGILRSIESLLPSAAACASRCTRTCTM